MLQRCSSKCISLLIGQTYCFLGLCEYTAVQHAVLHSVRDRLALSESACQQPVMTVQMWSIETCGK